MIKRLKINKMKSLYLYTMRKIVIVLLFVCGIVGFGKAQSTTTSTEDGFYKNLNLTAKDSLTFDYFEVFLSQLREPRYQLFKTQNKWIFLKLDTMTGQLWMVQYSLENNAGEFVLDTSKRISDYFDEPICGRFTLYSTDNMFNFILLDQIDGRCWQVQWHTEPDKVGVWRIY